MTFHGNRLLADDSHEISYLIFFSKIEKYVAKFVVCCSCDWRFKGYILYTFILTLSDFFSLVRFANEEIKQDFL